MAVALHDDLRFAIYFGDAQDQIYPAQYHPSIKSVANALPFDQLLFLKQVHGTNGMFVTHHQAAKTGPFSINGDFLITQEPMLGIGVVTADCLPVVCYDTQHKVAGIAHAGWRGAVAGVVEAMLQIMHKQCGTKIADILFFFGPSAKACCYQVDDTFGRQLDSCPFSDVVLERRDGKIYFDLPGLVWRQLLARGVSKSKINLNHNHCTIEDTRFCSHRRATQQGTAQKEGRQMTVVVVK